jgi:hypothetical protein
MRRTSTAADRSRLHFAVLMVTSSLAAQTVNLGRIPSSPAPRAQRIQLGSGVIVYCLTPKDGISGYAASSAVGPRMTVSADYCRIGLTDTTGYDTAALSGEYWNPPDQTPPYLHTAADIFIGSVYVPAGTYSLRLFGKRHEMDLLISRDLEHLAAAYDASQEIGRIRLMPGPAPEAPLSRMQLGFASPPGRICHARCDPQRGPYVPPDEVNTLRLHILWGNTDYYAVLRSARHDEQSTIAASEQQGR